MGIVRLSALRIPQQNIPLKPQKSTRGRPKLCRETIDPGTPELQAKKNILVGETRPSLKDLSQTLSLLYHRQAITQKQREAGLSYKLLWEEVQRFLGISPLSCSSLSFFGQIKTAYDPWDRPTLLPKRKAYFLEQWEEVQRLLLKEGIKTQQITHRVSCENYITPEMLQEDVPPPLELQQLKKGLNVLEKYFTPPQRRQIIPRQKAGTPLTKRR